MNPTLKQGEHDQIGVYERTGEIYEQYRYGSRFRQAYFKIRSETLADHLVKETRDKGTLHVLEVGCGTGITLSYLCKLPNLTLSGIDISTPMLKQAEEKMKELGAHVDLRLGSVFELPYETDSFDALYATRFIHQFTQEEKRAIYREFERVVRPGGLLVVEFYGNRFHREKLDRARYREKFPDTRDVRDVVGTSYRSIPISFRGGKFLAQYLGVWSVRVIVGMFRRVPVWPLINEYFVVSRNPRSGSA